MLLFAVVVYAMASTATAVSSTASPKKPNVVFIVIDDLGWDDVGFRSHQIRTPNIDARHHGIDSAQHFSCSGTDLTVYMYRSFALQTMAGPGGARACPRPVLRAGRVLAVTRDVHDGKVRHAPRDR